MLDYSNAGSKGMFAKMSSYEYIDIEKNKQIPYYLLFSKKINKYLKDLFDLIFYFLNTFNTRSFFFCFYFSLDYLKNKILCLKERERERKRAY